jgi:phosphate-selective porin OprO/OprP
MNNTPNGLMAAKRVAVAVAAVCATLAAPAYATDDVKNLLDLMLKKGVISQQDYDQFIKDNADAAENKQFKEKRLDDDVTKSVKFMQKRASDGNVKASGFGFVSGDGKSEINLTGRLHFDSRFFDSPFANGYSSDVDTVKFGDQFDARRARIGVNGKFLSDFNYEMVWNAAASDSSNVDTAWINYGANKEFQFRAGRFKQPFNLEDYGTSSNNIDFIERSYVNQINPGKKFGFMVHGVPRDGVVYAASIFQETNATLSATNNRQFAARVAANLATISGMKDSVLHFGLAATSGAYDTAVASATMVSLRSEHRGIEAFKAGFTSAGSTTVVSEVEKSLGGLEFVYASGPFKLQSEYVEGRYKANDLSAGTVDGNGTLKVQYVGAVYNITGEKWSDSYKDGAFGSIKPLSNFDPSGGGTGALQVGLRVSSYDASDLTGTITGSTKGNTTTLGLTWFINPNARIMLNHSVTNFDTALASSFTGAGTGDRESVTTIRTQFNF